MKSRLKSVISFILTSMIAASSLHISAYSEPTKITDTAAETENVLLADSHYVETDSRDSFSMDECLSTLAQSSEISTSNHRSYTLQAHDEVRIYTMEELGSDYSWTTVQGSGAPDCATIVVKSDGMYIVGYHPENEYFQVTIGSTTEYILATIYLANAVHRIDNASKNLRIKDTSNFYENKQAKLYTIESTDVLENDDLFKVVNVGEHLYCLRSMLNSSMALCKSGDDVVLKTIGTSDSSIPSEAKWYIRRSEISYGRFYIYNSSDRSDTLTCSNNATDGSNVETHAYSMADSCQDWLVEEYTIPDASKSNFTGVVIPNQITKLGIGEKYQLSADLYSYKSGENGGGTFTWSVKNGTGTATIDSSGIITGKSKGTVTVTAKDNQTSYSTSIKITIVNPITSGTYYIRNARTNNYLTYPETGTYIGLSSASYSSDQQWNLVLNENGYYNIVSSDGNYYVGYNGYSSDQRIIKRNDTGIYSDWCIVRNGTAYNIIPRGMTAKGNILYNTSENTLIETFSASATDSYGLWKLIRVTV